MTSPPSNQVLTAPLRDEASSQLASQHRGAAPRVEEEVFTFCNVLDVDLAAAIDLCEDTFVAVSILFDHTESYLICES
jgi:hypothetical protein